MCRIYSVYKFNHWLSQHRMNILAQFLRGCVRIVFSADIPPQMLIGKGTVFPHDALGVVFHPEVKIGSNCRILHGVTMGGRSGIRKLPVIGDNVIIGVGAIIIGDVIVGNNAIIGAGAVVIHDVPENAVVVGNPARIIRYIE